jgi:hypothetical protein
VDSRATPVILERDIQPSLEFNGWKLSYVSTWQEHKHRWTDLTIWAVDESERALWVVEVVGHSSVPGEVTRRDAIPCDSVQALKDALSKDGTITAPGRLVLQAAIEEDEELSYRMKLERTEKL